MGVRSGVICSAAVGLGSGRIFSNIPQSLICLYAPKVQLWTLSRNSNFFPIQLSECLPIIHVFILGVTAPSSASTIELNIGIPSTALSLQTLNLIQLTNFSFDTIRNSMVSVVFFLVLSNDRLIIYVALPCDEAGIFLPEYLRPPHHHSTDRMQQQTTASTPLKIDLRLTGRTTTLSNFSHPIERLIRVWTFGLRQNYKPVTIHLSLGHLYMICIKPSTPFRKGMHRLRQFPSNTQVQSPRILLSG